MTDKKDKKYNIRDNIRLKKVSYIVGDVVVARKEYMQVNDAHWGWRDLHTEEDTHTVNSAEDALEYYGVTEANLTEKGKELLEQEKEEDND